LNWKWIQCSTRFAQTLDS